MLAAPKSPLHPSALTLNALTEGRTILRFNRHDGVQGSFVVMERPCVHTTELGRRMMVKLKSVQFGTTQYHFLTDLGVLPSGNWFNDQNIVVDHRKGHLLPTELVPWPPDIFDEYDDTRFLDGPLHWDEDDRYPWKY